MKKITIIREFGGEIYDPQVGAEIIADMMHPIGTEDTCEVLQELGLEYDDPWDIEDELLSYIRLDQGEDISAEESKLNYWLLKATVIKRAK